MPGYRPWTLELEDSRLPTTRRVGPPAEPQEHMAERGVSTVTADRGHVMQFAASMSVESSLL